MQCLRWADDLASDRQDQDSRAIVLLTTSSGSPSGLESSWCHVDETIQLARGEEGAPATCADAAAAVGKPLRDRLRDRIAGVRAATSQVAEKNKFPSVIRLTASLLFRKVTRVSQNGVV